MDTTENDFKAFNGDVHLAEAFLKLKDLFQIEHVIETGTFHGHTTKWLGQNFDTVETIEANPVYAKIASETLEGCVNVVITLGDSSVGLKHLIEKNKDKRILIFLDAHWYKNPVLKELEQIAASGTKPVIVIHDFKNPNDGTMGYDVYPNEGITYEFEWIRSYVEKIYGDKMYFRYYNEVAVGARRGCLFLTPIEENSQIQNATA